jgi:hypothetical protein
MMDIEVREETRPRRDGDRHGRGGKGGHSRDRGHGRDGKQHDRRPPGGKFHDQVASMEPAEVAAIPAPAEAPQVPAPRQEPKPHKNHPRNEPRHEKRDRGSQRQHNEQAARPEAVDKSELPAFLFRPVPVKKREPQTE